ncbi:hypothetical protein P4050_15880 [Pseudomonas aeruginosa]|nr:hypothetical protein [Pseudomonas aeruginosa]
MRKAFQRNSMSDEERGEQSTDALQEIQDEGEKAQAARLKAYLDSEATRGQQSMDRLLETVRTNKEKRDVEPGIGSQHRRDSSHEPERRAPAAGKHRRCSQGH